MVCCRVECERRLHGRPKWLCWRHHLRQSETMQYVAWKRVQLQTTDINSLSVGARPREYLTALERPQALRCLSRSLVTKKQFKCLADWHKSFHLIYLFIYCSTGSLSPRKASCSRAVLPNLRWLFSCFHNRSNSDMDYRISNVHMWSFCIHI